MTDSSDEKGGCGCIAMIFFGILSWIAITASAEANREKEEKLHERIKRLEERLDDKLDKRPPA